MVAVVTTVTIAVRNADITHPAEVDEGMETKRGLG